jgi:hypothetical protein
MRPYQVRAGLWIDLDNIRSIWTVEIGDKHLAMAGMLPDGNQVHRLGEFDSAAKASEEADALGLRWMNNRPSAAVKPE